jgi:hypothetical protein
MASQQPTNNKNKGRILPFRSRMSRSWKAKLVLRDQSRSPVRDLSEYSRLPEDEDHPHRMFVNLLAFLALSFIIGCGIWLAENLSARDNRGCGRIDPTDCLPNPAPPDPK